MWRRILFWGASVLAVTGLTLTALVAHMLYRASPLELIIYMNPETYHSPFNWAARQVLFAFHPTPDEVIELNAEAGARYAANFPDPVEAEAILKHFLRHGVEIDSVDQGLSGPDPGPGPGWTALHLAAIDPNPQAVRLLLAHGANPDLRDRRGRNALDLARAAQQRHPGVNYAEVIALLETPQGKSGAPGADENR